MHPTRRLAWLALVAVYENSLGVRARALRWRVALPVGFSPRESHAVLTAVDESKFGFSRTWVSCAG